MFLIRVSFFAATLHLYPTSLKSSKQNLPSRTQDQNFRIQNLFKLNRKNSQLTETKLTWSEEEDSSLFTTATNIIWEA